MSQQKYSENRKKAWRKKYPIVKKRCKGCSQWFLPKKTRAQLYCCTECQIHRKTSKTCPVCKKNPITSRNAKTCGRHCARKKQQLEKMSLFHQSMNLMLIELFINNNPKNAQKHVNKCVKLANITSQVMDSTYYVCYIEKERTQNVSKRNYDRAYRACNAYIDEGTCGEKERQNAIERLGLLRTYLE